MDQPLPERFGPYVVLGRLGAGGMGVVYRARDTRLGREVAVKVLHRNLEISGARERFMREARTVSSLNHPNICTIFDIGEEHGDPYLVMELLEGESLKERLDRGPVDADDIREIAFRVALALQAAHAKGIVHRDIKPANLFLVADDHGSTDVKVLDFGLAKLEADPDRPASKPGLTRAGVTVGTVEYMSPEQACGESLDARSDLFSLGAVMYEMATGKIPFRGATSAIVFSELLNRDPVPPREANLNVPEDLDRLIRQLLVKDRAARTQTAMALLDALAQGDPELDTGMNGRKPDVSAEQPRPSAQPKAAGQPLPFSLPATPLIPSTSARADAPEKPRPGSPAAPNGLGNAAAAESGEKAAVADRRTSPRSVQVDAVGKSSRFPGSQGSPSDPVALNSPRQRRSAEMGAIPQSRVMRITVHEEEEEPWHRASPPARPVSGARRWWIWLVLLAVLGGGTYALLRGTPGGAPRANAFTGALQIMPLLNQTGNSTLDKAPTVAMELLLADVQQFAVRGPAPIDLLEGGTDGTSVQTKGNGPNGGRLAVLTGLLSHTNDGYLVHLDVKEAESAGSLASAEETVASVPEVGDALARLVSTVRQRMGEPGTAVDATPLRLGEAASESLPALAALGEAEAHAEEGDIAEALRSYLQTLQLDPHLLQAQLALAALQLRLHADADAEKTLKELAARPESGGPAVRQRRTYLLAQRSQAAPGSAASVAEAWRSSRPHDDEACATQSEELLEAGRAGDALEAANAAVALQPYRRRNQDALTAAQLAAGHPETAYATQSKAFNLGIGSGGLSLAAAFLQRSTGLIASALTAIGATETSVTTQTALANFYQQSGDRPQARSASASAEVLARALPSAASAETYLAALREWNGALAGECAIADQDAAGGAVVRVGRAAELHALANAWCGKSIAAARAPEGSVLLQAATAWSQGDRQAALAAIQKARLRGTVALLVRARLQFQLGQLDEAIADFRAVASQRGESYLSGTIATPAALAGLTAAYQSTGDQTNAATSQAALRDAYPGGADALLRAAATR